MPSPSSSTSDSSPGSSVSPTPLTSDEATVESSAITNLPEDWRYESSIMQVETIIEQIETGELELAEIFEQFAIAVQHLQDCDAFLNHHRRQVDILVETLTDEP